MKFEISSSTTFHKDQPEVEMLKERGVDVENFLTEWILIKEGQTIEIEDLDELLTFCHEFGGRLVIETDTPSIEIYNDWRE